MTSQRCIRSTLFTLAAALSAPALHGAAVVLPNSAALAEGSSSLNSAVQVVARTVQLQVAASQLADMPVGSVITSLSFRQEGGLSAAPASSYSYAQYTISLGQAANAIGSMSTTFSANMLSPVTVYDAPLTISASSYPGGSTPNPWGPSITFEDPYTYQGGDLVLLISHPASSSGSPVLLDAVGTASSEFRSIRTFVNDYDGGVADVTDNVFTVVNLGFTAAAVPEPSEVALVAGTGLLAWVGWRRLRR